MNRIVPAAVLLVAIAIAGAAQAAPQNDQSFATKFFATQILNSN